MPLDGLRLLASGKVRDLYEVDDGRLLIVASDRISAYDVVLPTPIPDKGAVLTALSVWWFGQLADVVGHHLQSVTDVPGSVRGRAMLVQRLRMLPVECVARGYLSGSGLIEYAATGSVCGVRLPGGLVEGSRLPEPVFTPATKAAVGEHDENIDFPRMVEILGAQTARILRDATLAVYRRAAATSEQRGILLADTKLEFGLDPAGRVVLADEVLTPDSSRFWPAQSWHPGGAQPSYDKQFVRDWLTAQDWDRRPPAPPLPPDVVEATRGRYVQAYEMLTGLSFSDWP